MKTLRISLAALVLGLGLGLGSGALADDDKKPARDCPAQEAYCIEMCEEDWDLGTKNNDDCQQECREAALVCEAK